MTSELSLGILSALAVGMAALTAISVRWAAFARSHLRAGVVQFFLAMMAGMFIGVLVYFAIGGTSGVVGGLWAASAIMSVSVLFVFVAFVREVTSRSAPRDPVREGVSRSRLVHSVVGLVILNEFLMGWSFSLLSGGLAPGLGPDGASALRIVSEAITSPWFVFPMALEMVLTLRWLMAVMPRPMRPFLMIQPAVMICSPPTLSGLVWEVSTAAAASTLMAVAVAMFLVALFRDVPLSPKVTGYAVSLILSFGLMSAGLYLWAEFSSPELFSLSLLVQMVVFLYASADPAAYSAAPALTGGRETQEMATAETGG